AHERQDGLGLLPRAAVPPRRQRSRMHQRVHRARYEAVVDDEVLLDAEARIAALEVARAVAAHAVAEREGLGANWGADRTGLQETQPLDRALQRRRREETASDRVGAKDVEGWHERQRRTASANYSVRICCTLASGGDNRCTAVDANAASGVVPSPRPRSPC